MLQAALSAIHAGAALAAHNYNIAAYSNGSSSSTALLIKVTQAQYTDKGAALNNSWTQPVELLIALNADLTKLTYNHL